MCVVPPHDELGMAISSWQLFISLSSVYFPPSIAPPIANIFFEGLGWAGRLAGTILSHPHYNHYYCHFKGGELES